MEGCDGAGSGGGIRPGLHSRPTRHQHTNAGIQKQLDPFPAPSPSAHLPSPQLALRNAGWTSLQEMKRSSVPVEAGAWLWLSLSLAQGGDGRWGERLRPTGPRLWVFEAWEVKITGTAPRLSIAASTLPGQIKEPAAGPVPPAFLYSSPSPFLPPSPLLPFAAAVLWDFFWFHEKGKHSRQISENKPNGARCLQHRQDCRLYHGRGREGHLEEEERKKRKKEFWEREERRKCQIS